MGNTVSEGAKPLPALLEISDTNTGTHKQDGCFLDSVYGTYVHGFFDAGDIALKLVKSLCAARGIEYTAPDAGPETNFRAYKERQYDTLADLLRGSVDIKKIYSILEDGLEWAV
jgi:adenosylcobyric acid synthase